MLCRTMHGIMYFFVIVILIGKPLDVYSDEVACISNYQELKESLLRRKCNVDALVSVFYPIGELRPSSVDVSYYQLPRNVDIGRNDSCNAWDQVIQEKDLAATKFRWLNSPTLLVADLHVLEHMSFMRLAVVEDRIDYIIVDPFCEKITDSEQIKILSLLTTFLRSFATDTQEDKDHKLYSIHIDGNSSSHLIRTFTATLLIPFKYCLYVFPYFLSILALVIVHVVVWIEGKSNVVSTGLSHAACGGFPNFIRKVITQNSFSYLSCTSVVLLIALTGYDLAFFLEFPDLDSAVWLISPFPVASSLFSLINIPLIAITIYVHGEYIPLPSLTRHTIRRCKCGSYKLVARIHQFFLLYCLTTLVVFLSFHFQWFIVTFLSYPVQVLSTSTYLLPIIFSISLIPYMVDILFSAKSTKRRVMTFSVFIVLGLFLILLVLAMYMFSSIVLLYAHTAPAWSGVLALLGTGSGGIILYIVKLASGEPEESEDSPKIPKNLSLVVSPLSRKSSLAFKYSNPAKPTNTDTENIPQEPPEPPLSAKSYNDDFETIVYSSPPTSAINGSSGDLNHRITNV